MVSGCCAFSILPGVGSCGRDTAPHEVEPSSTTRSFAACAERTQRPFSRPLCTARALFSFCPVRGLVHFHSLAYLQSSLSTKMKISIPIESRPCEIVTVFPDQQRLHTFGRRHANRRAPSTAVRGSNFKNGQPNGAKQKPVHGRAPILGPDSFGGSARAHCVGISVNAWEHLASVAGTGRRETCSGQCYLPNRIDEVRCSMARVGSAGCISEHITGLGHSSAGCTWSSGRHRVFAGAP